jgi:MFS family permease
MYRHPQDEIIVSTRPGPQARSVALIPIMAVVLIAFLIIGLALPVLPLHIHQGLGFGAFIVGLVTGSQFGASLLSRVWAGHYADRRGPKRAVVVGLLTAIAAGLLYTLSLRFTSVPPVSVTVLLLGRALLGSAESFIITGAVSWGLALVGAQTAGRVAWVGMAMFAALALGAPLGTALYSAGGFAAVAIAATLMRLLTVLLGARCWRRPSSHGSKSTIIRSCSNWHGVRLASPASPTTLSRRISLPIVWSASCPATSACIPMANFRGSGCCIPTAACYTERACSSISSQPTCGAHARV